MRNEMGILKPPVESHTKIKTAGKVAGRMAEKNCPRTAPELVDSRITSH
jgi:hypothetical protein